MYNTFSILYQTGWGAAVLAQLKNTKVKRNLYYEIKDRVLEEKTNGMTVNKHKERVKIYGFDETKANRELLMEILRDRMDNHKAKFISPIIYNELCTLEVKKNGRIEHSTTAHDDQVFSYLLALYIWYEGKDLMERFGLQKSTISTDEDQTVERFIEDNLTDISADMKIDGDPIAEQNKEFFSKKSMSYMAWLETQQRENFKADEMLRNDPRSRDAWYKHNHIADDGNNTVGLVTIPDDVFRMDMEGAIKSDIQRQFDAITELR